MAQTKETTQPRRCLVLGGTGHIGNAFVRALLQDGHEVSVTCRQKGPRANLAGLDTNVLTGDDNSPGQLADWIRGHQIVIDAAAPYPIRLFDCDLSHRQRLEIALKRCQILIKAVQDQDADLVYISSFTTLPKHGPWYQRLQSGVIQGSHPYFETKAAIEREIVKVAYQGLKAVVINPTVCLGPWDLKPPDTCFVVSVARGELWGVTRQALNVIDVRDVASAALAALAGRRYGQPIPLSGHNVDFDSLVHKICHLAGQPAPLLQASTRLTAIGSYWLDAAFGAFGQASPIPSLPSLLLCECRAMTPSAVQRELGVSLRPLDATLRDSLNWYRQIGHC